MILTKTRKVDYGVKALTNIDKGSKYDVKVGKSYHLTTFYKFS